MDGGVGGGEGGGDGGGDGKGLGGVGGGDGGGGVGGGEGGGSGGGEGEGRRGGDEGGGSSGGRLGGMCTLRSGQSGKSDPRAHNADSLPGPPSSQMPLSNMGNTIEPKSRVQDDSAMISRCGSAGGDVGGSGCTGG